MCQMEAQGRTCICVRTIPYDGTRVYARGSQTYLNQCMVLLLQPCHPLVAITRAGVCLVERDLLQRLLQAGVHRAAQAVQ